MNELAALAFTAFGAAAAIDWWAVARRIRRVEYVAKPAALLALIATALALEPSFGAQRGWFVVALCFSLAGDVFLMMPRDLFIAGLASFLVAHVAYIVGFLAVSEPARDTWIVSAIIGVVATAALVPVLRALRSRRPKLAGPVALYAIVISVMVIVALTRGAPSAWFGALLFFASDYLIARNRFVKEHRYGKLAIIVTYHSGQALLVLSLM